MKTTIQISPYGVFEKVEEGGRRFVQVCDAVAFDQVLRDWTQRGRPKILLDYLHKRGEAAGWITELRTDPAEGLLGDVEYTPPGAKSVAEKIYRYPSADWSCGADGRPFSLAAVGLTNTPNIPVRALTNSASGSSGGLDPETKPQQTRTNMDSIKKLLGLPPEADEAAVEAAVKALLDKINQAAADAVKAKGESVAAANAERIQNSAAFVAAYCQAPDAVEAALKTLKAPAAPAATRVVNSASATQPARVNAAARKFATKAEAKDALAKQPVGQRKAFFDENKAEFED